MFISEDGRIKLALVYWKKDGIRFDYDKHAIDTLSIAFLVLSSALKETSSDLVLTLLQERLLCEKCYKALSVLKLPKLFMNLLTYNAMDVLTKRRMNGLMQVSAV